MSDSRAGDPQRSLSPRLTSRPAIDRTAQRVDGILTWGAERSRPARAIARRLWTMSLAHALVIVVTTRFAVFVGLHIHSLATGEQGLNAVPYGGLDDGRLYYAQAQALADGRSAEVLNSYPVVLSYLLRIGIDQIWLLKFANTVAGLLAVLVLARLANEASRSTNRAEGLFHPETLLLAGLFPAAGFWSSNSLMRDAWVYLFVALGLWWLDDLVVERKFRAMAISSIAGLALCLGALGTLRWYAVAIFGIVAAIVFATRRTSMSLSRPMTVAIVALPFVILIAFAGNEVLADVLGVRPLDYRDDPLLDGGSELDIDFGNAGPVASVPLYVWSVLSNTLGPFPGQARSPLQYVPLLVEFPIQLVVIVSLWRRRRSTSPTARTLFTFGIVWLMVLGLWNDSLGNATRIRVVGWMALITAAGAARSPSLVIATDDPRHDDEMVIDLRDHRSPLTRSLGDDHVPRMRTSSPRVGGLTRDVSATLRHAGTGQPRRRAEIMREGAPDR